MHPGAPPPSPSLGNPQPRPPATSALAVASLVLGILGFCTGVTGFLAVVFGHMSLSRIRRARGALGGKGIAIGGLATGYVTSVIGAFILAGLGTGMMRAIDQYNDATEPFELNPAPAPDTFPDLPETWTVLEPSGIRVAQIQMGGGRIVPGTSTQFRVYLPPGDHAPRSLPCVLVAPAGTTLLHGADLGTLDDDSYHDECLPYAEAGLAVVFYSIDGHLDDDTDDLDANTDAYNAFLGAGAGTVNGRNAFEFALARLPAVDPGRIVSAGHSSAGTLSLLLAAHEPRLAGSIAYCPAFDLESHFAEAIDELGIGVIYPGFRNFVRRSSPQTHVTRFGRPLFLFFSESDMMIDHTAAQAFADLVRQTNANTHFESVPSGGHYQSMIDHGIPAGIDWIQSLPPATPVPLEE